MTINRGRADENNSEIGADFNLGTKLTPLVRTGAEIKISQKCTGDQKLPRTKEIAVKIETLLESVIRLLFS